MRLSISFALLSVTCVHGFVAPRARVSPSNRVVSLSSTETSVETGTPKPVEQKAAALGLITFDLDDTFYPIAPVIDQANKAFAKAMEKFGYEGIQPSDIDLTGKAIREEISLEDPERAAILTHTEIRELAVRREMEKNMLERKLKETADDWATPVSDLADVVVSYAKKWARTAVSPSIVDAVLTAWEMERHHAAERNLYPEVVDFFRELKQQYPGVIIGAVTDGKANPMLMGFTLGPYFDFCMSWEDDQGGRSKFFKDLGSVEGNAELSWIYNAAYEQYEELSEMKSAIDAEKPDECPTGQDCGTQKLLWIHVGDDLAYDVGGAAACGAKTILVELAEKYGQTARLRFQPESKQPQWSTNSATELEKRRIMNENAKSQVDQKVAYLSQLMEAVNSIVEDAAKKA